MKARSRYLGDPKDSEVAGHPSTWLFGGTTSTVPHVLVVLAAERQRELDAGTNEFRDNVEGLGAILWEQRGAVLPGDVEHFGFRDGISQVGVRGRLSTSARHFLTRRWFDPADPRALQYARPGQPMVWPGQFVFGYRRGDPLDALSPGEIKHGAPVWTTDGSLLVLRRLRQDVAAFRDFVSGQAALLQRLPGFADMTADKVAAKLVGRGPNGSALARTPDRPSADESSDMLCINAFEYATEWAPSEVCSDAYVRDEGLAAVPIGELRTTPGAPADSAGLRCPTFAHVRKVNPRGMNTDQANSPLSTRQFQMLRRGITWGSGYSTARAGDDGDRGLLFMSYQTSIANQFEKLTLAWMNLEDPPEGPSGQDLLVGQDNEKLVRRAVLRSDDPAHPDAAEAIVTETHQPWIVATGGEYLFAPSKSALQQFAREG
jgi:Dyp-type peroxidase family